MTIRSMTAFAQVKTQVNDQLSFTLALKSVNHRFLDLHLRMPAETDALEMKLRRILKDKLARGHVDLTLTVERTGAGGFSVNKQLVGGYLEAFRSAAEEFGVSAEPDLNAILKIPGALESSANSSLAEDAGLESAVVVQLEKAIHKLSEMRAEEGRSIERELRERLARLKSATAEVHKFRSAVLRAYVDKIQTRIEELVGAHVDQDRVMQEAAL